jgi:predicted transposase YdaD
MHEYDVAFKLTLQQVDVAMRELTGKTIAHWLNVELPEVRNARVDLLGETDDRELVHIELQSTNDRTMPLRMAEYHLAIYRSLGRFPYQVLLYVGDAPLRMEAALSGPSLQYFYKVVDIRELDGERLLESPSLGDNIIAILTRLPDARAAVRRIMERIAGLPAEKRGTALKRLLILAGLRKLGPLVKEEVNKMPIVFDIREDQVLGPVYEKGWQQGELAVLRRLIEKRFGSIPAWVEERLGGLPAQELEDLSVRLLDATRIEELLG